MKILIIEPDTNRQRQLRTILASLGHKSGEIETVSDSKAASSTMKKKKFDCTFVGIFSNFDGHSIVKEIRASATNKSIPCIVYSSEITKESVIAAKESGANNIVGYPFSVSDVELVIKQIFPKQ